MKPVYRIGLILLSILFITGCKTLKDCDREVREMHPNANIVSNIFKDGGNLRYYIVDSKTLLTCGDQGWGSSYQLGRLPKVIEQEPEEEVQIPLRNEEKTEEDW